MSTNRVITSSKPPEPDTISKPRSPLPFGPIALTGTKDSLYERHLIFDNVLDPTALGARERFEAIARSVRDLLSERWINTESTYNRENPKRVYYLSMEFLIGRSLPTTLTNLLLHPIIKKT